MVAPETPRGRIETTTYKGHGKCTMEFFFNSSQNNPRFLGVQVIDKELVVIIGGVKHPIRLRDGHQSFRAPNPEWEAVTLNTPLGQLSVSWGEWGRDPIPPGGIIGTVFLHAKPATLQLLDIRVDETGKELEIRLTTDANHPRSSENISLKPRKASEQIWTVRN